MPLEIDLSSIPENPEDLQKVFEQLENGATPAAKTEPPSAPEQSDKAQGQGEPKGEADPQSQQQQQQSQTEVGEDAAGVATKDGKHVIPYTVLQTARDRAARAEQINQQLTERLDALEAQLKSGSQGAKEGESARTEPLPAEVNISTEDLEALKEDFPTVYKAVMASMTAAKNLEQRLAPVEQTAREVVGERHRSDAETVQEAIDSVPKLAHIQATNKHAFELAQQFDQTLRGQPAWADKSLSERFGKVIEMVESTLGPIDLPAQKTTLSPEQLAAQARKVAAQAAKSSVPTSLSEFPAGQHAAQDEREAASQMNHQQLAEKLAGMTPDQMDAYLNSL